MLLPSHFLTYVPRRPGENSQLQTFLFRPPLCALCLSCLLHLCFILNMSEHRPKWQAPKSNPFTVFCISAGNTSIHPVSKARNQNTSHNTVFNYKFVINYKSQQYHLQTSFKSVFFFFSATTTAATVPQTSLSWTIIAGNCSLYIYPATRIIFSWVVHHLSGKALRKYTCISTCVQKKKYRKGRPKSNVID